MKITQKILLGSIILLLTTTPILASADLSKNTSLAPLYIFDNNCLGDVTLIHDPGLVNIIRNKGVRPSYDPPSGNPNYDYYFPQNETGYVFMNFTLHVKHRLNDIPVYWGKLIWPDNHRYSMVKVWINYDGLDYCIANATVVCNKFTWEYFDIPVICNTPLYTNNQTIECLFWVTVWAIYTPLPGIQLLFERFLSQSVVSENIFIHPVLT